jgi:hypothetical protein
VKVGFWKMIKAGKAKDVLLLVKYISACQTNSGINKGDKVPGKTGYDFHFFDYFVQRIATR